MAADTPIRTDDMLWLLGSLCRIVCVPFDAELIAQQFPPPHSRVTLREGVEPNPPRLIKGFKRVVLHPEKAQDTRESLKLYREIFGLS